MGNCGDPTNATLTTEGKDFAFTPSDGVIQIRGNIAADGTVRAQLVTPGADKKPFVMTLTARMIGDHVEGSYVTPRCAFTVSLDRVHPALF